MAFRLTPALGVGKYAKLGFMKNMPKEYVDKYKFTKPWRIYGNRFGAPPVVKRLGLKEEEYIYGRYRPFEREAIRENIEEKYIKLTTSESRKGYFQSRASKVERIPDEEWVFFPGDHVRIMVGEDKDKIGIVAMVIRERNFVFVSGLHCKLEVSADMQKMTGHSTYMKVEQPLDVSLGEVKLIDPSDDTPVDAEWRLNEEKTDVIRVSTATDREIPIPTQAYRTYEYTHTTTYIEGEKDTVADLTMERTYKPKLLTFEEDIMEEMGITEDRKYKKSYWY